MLYSILMLVFMLCVIGGLSGVGLIPARGDGLDLSPQPRLPGPFSTAPLPI